VSGTVFTWAILGYLKEASFEYDIKIKTPSEIFESKSRPNARYEAQVVHQDTYAENIRRNDASWWWRYHLIFYCFWGDADPSKTGQLIDETILRKIKVDLYRYLRNGFDTVRVFGFHEQSHGLLGLAIEDPRTAMIPFVDGPLTDPPTSSPSQISNTNSPRENGDFGVELADPTYASPINARLWVS